MPHKQPRVRVERGLYKAGATYYAGAVPPGEKRPRWKSLGKVNLTRARDLRDRFVAEVRSGGLPRRDQARRAASTEWRVNGWRVRAQLVRVDELRSQTFDSYEIAVRVHLKPYFGSGLSRLSRETISSVAGAAARAGRESLEHQGSVDTVAPDPEATRFGMAMRRPIRLISSNAENVRKAGGRGSASSPTARWPRCSGARRRGGGS